MREFPRPTPLPRDADFPEEFDADVDRKHTDIKLQEVIAKSFSKFLVREMTASLDRKEFDQFIVCAESHFLEIFLSYLGPHLKGRLLGSASLDLYNVNESDLMSYVRDILPPAYYKSAS